VGFAAAVEEDPGMLLLGRLGVESPEIAVARILFRAGSSTLQFEEVDLQPLFLTPEVIGGGALDSDVRQDLVGLFTLRAPGGLLQYFAQSVLGVQHRGRSISGMMPLGASIEAPRLWLKDFDGDGVTDWAVWRILSGANGTGNDQCLAACEEAYRACVPDGGQDCEAAYQECKLHCQDPGSAGFLQTLDIYYLGR
jgi:hypothetical protein